MRLEHHLVGGYVRYISPHIIIIIIIKCMHAQWAWLWVLSPCRGAHHAQANHLWGEQWARSIT